MAPRHQPPQPLFTAEEYRALNALRIRYLDDHDLFTQSERAHLGFLRWLREAGRLESEPRLPSTREGPSQPAPTHPTAICVIPHG